MLTCLSKMDYKASCLALHCCSHGGKLKLWMIISIFASLTSMFSSHDFEFGGQLNFLAGLDILDLLANLCTPLSLFQAPPSDRIQALTTFAARCSPVFRFSTKNGQKLNLSGQSSSDLKQGSGSPSSIWSSLER